MIAAYVMVVMQIKMSAVNVLVIVPLVRMHVVYQTVMVQVVQQIFL